MVLKYSFKQSHFCRNYLGRQLHIFVVCFLFCSTHTTPPPKRGTISAQILSVHTECQVWLSETYLGVWEFWALLSFWMLWLPKLISAYSVQFIFHPWFLGGPSVSWKQWQQPKVLQNDNVAVVCFSWGGNIIAWQQEGHLNSMRKISAMGQVAYCLLYANPDLNTDSSSCFV